MKIRFVVPPQFKMFQARSTCEKIEGDVEHMISLGVGHVQFEDWTVAINGFRQTDLPDHLLNSRQPAAGHGMNLLSQFQSGRGTPQHRRLHAAVLIVDPALPSTLSCIELSS
jgi:hypothetical protein